MNLLSIPLIDIIIIIIILISAYLIVLVYSTKTKKVYCTVCDKVTVHVVTSVTQGLYLICQSCGNTTIINLKDKKEDD